MTERLPRLGELGGGDDDGRLGRCGRSGERAGSGAEEAREEARADRGDAVARLLGLAVDGNEREHRPLRGDRGEERLADAAEVVEAVDEERVGAFGGLRRRRAHLPGTGPGWPAAARLRAGAEGFAHL